MCVVSNIGDWGRKWTDPLRTPPQRRDPYDDYLEHPLNPNIKIWPMQLPGVRPTVGITWTPEMFAEFKELLDRVRKLEEDAAGKCEDPSKTNWIIEMEKHLNGENE